MDARFIDGLVLAAIVADQPSSGVASGGLAPGLERALRARLDALAGLGREERREEVTRLAASVRPIDARAALLPRAGAILASDVPKELGRKWVAHAPPVRRGFRVSAPLKATLRRLAVPSNRRVERNEREAASRATQTQIAWASRLGADEERIRGALVLGAEGDRVGDAISNPWRRIGSELAEVEGAAWRD